mmetsp:Transcript_10715/g.26797  ORF Transcript_10715/g.26797 Transcript_10715/m.26797 type:complete len:255 (-) Transcript_10715:419-1183(-)
MHDQHLRLRLQHRQPLAGQFGQRRGRHLLVHSGRRFRWHGLRQHPQQLARHLLPRDLPQPGARGRLRDPGGARRPGRDGDLLGLSREARHAAVRADEGHRLVDEHRGQGLLESWPAVRRPGWHASGPRGYRCWRQHPAEGHRPTPLPHALRGLDHRVHRHAQKDPVLHLPALHPDKLPALHRRVSRRRRGLASEVVQSELLGVSGHQFFERQLGYGLEQSPAKILRAGHELFARGRQHQDEDEHVLKTQRRRAP